MTIPARLAAPDHLPPAVARGWAALATARRPAVPALDIGARPDLPPAVRRWLTTALPAGASTATTAVLAMDGSVRMGRRLPFTARQVLAPDEGFVWAAVAGRGVHVTGYDRWQAGAGEMRWCLPARLPVLRASGPDVTRSAAGRLAGETMLLPAAALAPWCRWLAGDDRIAQAEISTAATVHRVEVEVDADGLLRRVSFDRWGDPDGEGHRMVPFGVTFGPTRRWADVAVPESLVAGWGWGDPDWEERAFFHARILGVIWCGDGTAPSAVPQRGATR